MRTQTKRKLNNQRTRDIENNKKITLDQPGFDSLEIVLEQMEEAERKQFCKRALHIE